MILRSIVKVEEVNNCYAEIYAAWAHLDELIKIREAALKAELQVSGCAGKHN